MKIRGATVSTENEKFHVTFSSSPLSPLAPLDYLQKLISNGTALE